MDSLYWETFRHGNDPLGDRFSLGNCPGRQQIFLQILGNRAVCSQFRNVDGHLLGLPEAGVDFVPPESEVGVYQPWTDIKRSRNLMSAKNRKRDFIVVDVTIVKRKRHGSLGKRLS